ncbi:hypothetical protein ACQ33O_07040 [Ferruginibacter sp. SUN002]|uniref:hypothetical protein n=1 Tax=Ferruginibacter sp. SUN002 TaxID=2937789 RepID=UPI003D35DE3A
MNFKKLLFVCLLFAFANTATAQIGMGVGVLGSAINKKKEKKAKAAAEKAAQEQAVKDSIDNAQKELARIEYQKRQDSLDVIAKAERKIADSIKDAEKKAKKQEAEQKAKLYSRPTWEKLGMDSVEFRNHYGSDYEYSIQKQKASDSWCKYTTFLYGVKYGYTDFIVSYLESKGWEYDMKKTTALLTFKLKRYNGETEANEVINMSFPLDKNSRITGGTITGTSSAIIRLYIDYWDSQLKSTPQGTGTYYDYGSDKIIFKWVAGKPVITITKGLVSFEFEAASKKYQ